MIPTVTALEFHRDSQNAGLTQFLMPDTLRSLQRRYLHLCKVHKLDQQQLGQDPEKLIKTAQMGWISYAMKSPFLKDDSGNYEKDIRKIIEGIFYSSDIPAWRDLTNTHVYVFNLPANEGIAGALLNIDAGYQILQYIKNPILRLHGTDPIAIYVLQLPILKIFFDETQDKQQMLNLEWLVTTVALENVRAIHRFLIRDEKKDTEQIPPRKKAFTAFHNIFKKL